MVEVQWQRVKDVLGCVQDLREEAIKIYPTNIFLLTKTGSAGCGMSQLRISGRGDTEGSREGVLICELNSAQERIMNGFLLALRSALARM